MENKVDFEITFLKNSHPYPYMGKFFAFVNTQNKLT